MPSYEVIVKAHCVVVVENCESEDEALELAWENISRGDFEVEEASIEQELLDEDSLSQAVRHCHRVV